MKPTYEELEARLANAESKCMGLAAENTRAKKIISECREYFIAGVMNRIRPTNEGYLHMICDTFEDETPATDAFQAEVRASGVEMYADNLDSSADDAERDGFDDAVKFLRSEASGVRLFAAQIRKGVQS